MKAKVTTAFRGMDNSSTEPVDIKVGAELTDNPAWQAVQAGYAEWTPDGKPSPAEEDIMRSAPAPKYPLEPKASANAGLSGSSEADVQDADRMGIASKAKSRG